MQVSAAIGTVQAAAGNPSHGLPEEIFLFVSRITPLVNVDLLIQDDGGRTLLTWRDDEFFGKGWHVPGGIVRYKEVAADRVRACAMEELGAEVSFDPAPILVSETIREERTRGHFISLLYRCRLVGAPAERLRAQTTRPQPGQWRWHSGRPADLLAVQSQYARFIDVLDS